MMLALLALLFAWSLPAPGLGSGQASAAGSTTKPAVEQKQQSTAPSMSELEALSRRHPDDPKGWVLLGLAYLDRSEYPRALEAFQHAVKVGPQSAEAHNWLGVALAEKADLPGAIAELRKAVALDPRYGRAYSNLGATLAQSGDYGEAVRVFKQALALEPNNIGAHLNLGTALRETGDLEGALEHLRRVADAEPDSASVQYEIGQTLGQSGNIAGAITAFERALEIDPELREGYYALGAALKKQSAAAARTTGGLSPSPADDLYRRAQDAFGHGDLPGARDQLEQALRLDDKHAGAHTLLGFALGQQGDLPAAVRHLERAIALRPDSSEAHYHLGVALWYSGGRERATAELRESVKLDPAAGESHAFLGTVLRERGDWAGGRVSLQRAIALLPPTAAVFIDLGITYLRAGRIDNALGQFEAGLNVPPPSQPTPDWGAAVAALRQALSVPAAGTPPQTDGISAADRQRAEAHNLLGRLLGRAGATSGDVASAFREAIRLRPDYAEAHNNLGLVLIQAGDDPNGIAALREAVRLAPDYAEARANLGAALTPTDPDEAIRELEQAVALAPTSARAQFNLASAYGSSSRYGAAKEIEQLRKVIDLAPTFARARFALGKALLADSQIPDAVGALQEAARLEPTNGETHYQLGLALARAGRKDEAAAELQKGRELTVAGDRTRNASVDIAEGRAALDRGELDAATAKFRHAAQLEPDSPDAQQYLGSALEKQGNTDAAIASYRKALALNAGATAAKERLDALTKAAPKSEDARRIAEFEGYIRDGRFKEVEPLLAAYVKERPTASWGWYALGYSLFGQQKIGESIRALAKSLELDVRNAEAHKILGRDLMIIGRFDAAQVEFEQAIRYQPGSAESHYNLGKLFSIQDNWDAARKAFEAALRIEPSYVEAMDALGLVLEALGDDEGAVTTYRKAIALNEARNGTYALPHINLSAYYNRTGNPEKALEHARSALALDPKSDRALFQQGRAYERQDKLDEAVLAMNQAIVLNPRGSSYYYVLAGVYRRLGWMEESRKALEAFQQLEKESSELEKKRRATGGR
jgi:tetratricopeptide (TPR) repeat protein